MPTNKVSATMSATDLQDVLNAITTIGTKMPFLISLTLEERKSLAKFGDRSLAFVTKALELAIQRTDILPRNFDVNEFKKDVDLYNQLYSITQPLSLMLEKLNDTQKEVGSEAYSAALIVYQSAKMSGSDLGGLESVLDDLGKRFAKKSTTAAENGNPA